MLINVIMTQLQGSLFIALLGVGHLAKGSSCQASVCNGGGFRVVNHLARVDVGQLKAG